MIVGTAGHIDHGKSSLVRALTGIDTDRLPAEKARGITIDLGFAYVPLPGGGLLGFVDVPGHERLVHTMIAGAASIGMALLVVAADDGIMPQTREHLHILSLLGVTRQVVALTKIDRVDALRILAVETEIGALLPGAEVFPLSPVTGAGIDALRSRLLDETTRDTFAADDGRAFRLSIDRAFSIAGAGTVVTGSVVAGTVRAGDTVLLLPSGMRARVRGIHAGNLPVERASAGDRCALNLTGPGIRKETTGRGDWAVDPEHGMMSHRCDVELRVLNSERAALKSGTPVLVHHGAAQISGRVVVLDTVTLAPGETGLAQLLLDRDAPLRHGDRLVLRDTSASRTIAGGRVLDPRAPIRQRRGPERIAVLRALASGEDRAALRGVLALPPFLLRRDALLADWGLYDAGLTALVPDTVMAGGFLVTSPAVTELTRHVTAALTEFHTRQPAMPGITASALRQTLPVRLPRDSFPALLAHLLESGTVAAEGHLFRAPDHRGDLTGADALLWARLRPLLEAVPFRPPLLREAAGPLGTGDVALRRACKGFARSGLLVEVAPDRFFVMKAVPEMAAAAHALSAETADGWFTAAQYRDRIGCGRQLAIQVLDYFDRRGVTVRRGDLRRAGKPGAMMFV